MKRIVWSVFVALIMLCPLGAEAQRRNEAVIQLQKLNTFYRYLQGMYVDSLQLAPLVESGIRSMLADLDPHSVYLTAEEMREQNESFEGEFSGVGIEYNIYRDSILVINTVDGGPSERAGLRANDRIVTINGESVVGITRDDVTPKLRGLRGSVVRLGVARRGEPSLRTYDVVRDNIPITTVDAAFMADEGIAYIKVNRFGRTTMREFREAMAQMSGVESLILDLSSNGGGLLDQAVEMAGYFLPRQALVTYIEGRTIGPEVYRSNAGGEFSGNVVVIIDEASASGSEIVAGALQDWDRAVIVGDDSFGKGLVQRQIPLGDGSAMRLTVARYHTPSGRVIQRPYEKGHKDEYYKAHIARLNGQESDSTQNALPQYLTLRSRRTVHGGGGIQPDVRVKSDTTRVSNYMARMVAQGVYNDFLMEYMDLNREQLDRMYPSFAEFEREFVLTPQQLTRLTKAASERNIEYNESEFNHSKELILTQLKAMIAQRLYSTCEFYRVMNPRENAAYKRALEILRAWDEQGAKILAGQ
ncbi:MAG: S41 family peptidase [Alistipes sp.]|nr:S41 family peptidase [Alistipes sp.]